MPYCTVADVRNAVDFPETGAPISDSVIQEFIYDAEDEIQFIYKTHFGNVEDSGTASSGTTTTLVDSSKTWLTATDTQPLTDFTGYVVWIYNGTGSGQYREIASNNDTTLTVTRNFTTAPDNTSQYRIVKLGYIEETVDGSGYDYMFTNKQPLVNVNYLKNNNIEVDPTTLYKYTYEAKLITGPNSEINYFSDATPQLTEIRYVYGWYPIPRIIKRLCIILAAMRALTAQIAGTYDDFANVSLPHMSASKGEPYLNIQSSLNYMQGEAKGIIYGSGTGGQVSADFRIGSSFKPLAYFG